MVILELRNDPTNLECPRECVQLEVSIYSNLNVALGQMRQYLGVRRMHSTNNFVTYVEDEMISIQQNDPTSNPDLYPNRILKQKWYQLVVVQKKLADKEYLWKYSLYTYDNYSPTNKSTSFVLQRSI